MARSRRPLSLLLPLLPPRSIIVDRDPRGPLHSPQILHDSSSSRSSSSSSSSSSRGGGRAVKGMAPPLRDPGDWIFSPEWWGIQGRGWGRDEGSTLFRHTSHRSNGIVTVTSHPASSSVSPHLPHIVPYHANFRISFHSMPCHFRISFFLF